MLLGLRIENFVLVERLDLRFHEGLCVLTGETGAGKSLLLDALQAVLGARMSPEVIRNGARFAYLEATFSLTPELRDLLQREGFEEIAEEDTLVLSRTIQRSGSKSRLQGQLVSQSLLRTLGELLIDSAGQHENQILFRPDQHRALLDSWGDEQHQALCAQMQQIWQQLSTCEAALQASLQAQQEQERQRDFFEFQLLEIDEAALQPGEEAQLVLERERLRHADKLQRNLRRAWIHLSEGETLPSICERLEEVVKMVSNSQQHMPELESLSHDLDHTLAQLQAAARSLEDHCEQVEVNPARLEEVEARLYLLQRLRSKYGETEATILAHAETLRSQLEHLRSNRQRQQELESERSQLISQAQVIAHQLSAARLELARRLPPVIERELKDLGMGKTRFEVACNPGPLSAYGQDQVAFLISPNPGEPLRPLARTASGGEASRLLLALKVVLNEAQAVPTLIFDEVDSGMGGKTALAVAQKLSRLAQARQVVCISHLPVIAAMAGQQLWIEKHLQEQDTRIEVHSLDAEHRIEKLAQMASGKITPSSLKNAREMVRHAREYNISLAVS
jgi:DNA repair protein RecN (Recombination protein N)